MKKKVFNKGLAVFTTFAMVFNMFMPFVTVRAIGSDQNKVRIVFNNIDANDWTDEVITANSEITVPGGKVKITSEDCTLTRNHVVESVGTGPGAHDETFYYLESNTNCSNISFMVLPNEEGHSSKMKFNGEDIELTSANTYAVSNVNLGTLNEVDFRIFDPTADVRIQLRNVTDQNITTTNCDQPNQSQLCKVSVNLEHGRVDFESTDITYVRDQINDNPVTYDSDIYVVVRNGSSLKLTLTPNGEYITRLMADGNALVLDQNNSITFNNVTYANNYSFDYLFEEDNRLNVDFGTGSWQVGSAGVSADKSGVVKLNLDDEIVLTNFDPGTMAARVSVSDFHVDLVVVDGRTRLNARSEGGYPSGTLTFAVVLKSEEPGPNQNNRQTIRFSGSENVFSIVKNGNDIVGAKYTNLNIGKNSTGDGDLIGSFTITGFNGGTNGEEVTYHESSSMVENHEYPVLDLEFESDKFRGAYLVIDFDSNVPEEFINSLVLNFSGTNVRPYLDGSTYKLRLPYIVNDQGNLNYGEFSDLREEGFDSILTNAYFAWVCNSDNTKVCYHKFYNLKQRESIIDENGDIVKTTFETTYIPLANVIDQSGNSGNEPETFNFTNEFNETGGLVEAAGNTTSNWVRSSGVCYFGPDDQTGTLCGMEDENGNIRANLTKTDVFGTGFNDRGIMQLDPTGGGSGINSISHNGDRSFRVTIYKPGYVGIEFSNDEDDYTYFPGLWDPVFFQNAFDVSGTSETNALPYDSYLLEPKLTLWTDTYSSKTITSVTPLNVPDGAIDVNALTGADAGKFEIVFNSNYYDEVVFELSDSSQNKYYFRINRIVINPKVSVVSRNSNAIDVSIMYPTYKSENVEHTENDFEIIANIKYKDGTTKTVISNTTVSGVYGISGEPISQKRYESGKNLMGSTYRVSLPNKSNIDTVNVSIQYKGATEDNALYKGMFSGSGKGFTYEFDEGGNH